MAQTRGGATFIGGFTTILSIHTNAGNVHSRRLRAVRSHVRIQRCPRQTEGSMTMPTYIVLGNFTDQGIRNIKDTTKRASAVKESAKKVGASVKNLYWTLGAYNVVTVLDATRVSERLSQAASAPRPTATGPTHSRARHDA
jgi:uncharacterized protein with GYD domain